MNSHSERHDNQAFHKRFMKGFWMAVLAGLVLAGCLFGMALFAYLGTRYGF